MPMAVLLKLSAACFSPLSQLMFATHHQV